MPKRNVVLTQHHEDIIDRLVRSGRYQNASEVLREGLRLIEMRQAREVFELQALREAAQVGFLDLEEGRFVDVENDGLDKFIAGLGRRVELEPHKPCT